MKLGKDISLAVADIPDVYLDRFVSVLDALEQKQVEALCTAKPDDLLTSQKLVQTIRTLKKAIRSAPEEAQLYKERNT